MSSGLCYNKQLTSNGPTIVNEASVYRPCTASNNASTFTACCYPGDTCLEGNMCGYTHARGGGTGFYVAGCTDPSFNDPSCTSHCGDQFWPDIVYSFNSGLWACCSSALNVSDPNCQKPTSDTWEEPPPSQLKRIASIPASAASTPGWRPAVTASASGSASTSPFDASPAAATTAAPAAAVTASNSGLTAGAKAGIGVGVGLGVPLLLAAVGAVFFFRRRQRRHDQERHNWNAASQNWNEDKRPESLPQYQPPANGSLAKPYPPVLAPSANGHAEMPNTERPTAELP